MVFKSTVERKKLMFSLIIYFLIYFILIFKWFSNLKYISHMIFHMAYFFKRNKLVTNQRLPLVFYANFT